MNKKEVKKILFSIRNSENEAIVNNLLGAIDMKSNEEIEGMLNKILIEFNMEKGQEIEAIKQYIEIKKEKQNRRVFPFTKINDFFEYGINGGTVHFHLPGDFHSMFQKLGKVKASVAIGKSLIDAANKINNQRKMGDQDLEKCSSMYMISPIFYSPTFYPKILRDKNVRDNIKIETPIFKIFKLMGLETATYTREELQNDDFVKNNKEAQLAVKNFGADRDVGAAILTFEKFNSEKFQRRLKRLDKFLGKILNPIREER